MGQSIHLHTFANGKTYDVEVQILRREKVEAYWGPVDALVVRPLMRFEEILRQKGEVLIWVTDDDRRLPIRMLLPKTISSNWGLSLRWRS